MLHYNKPGSRKFTTQLTDCASFVGRQLFQNDESLAKSDEAFIDDGVIHVNNGSNSIQEPAVKIDETLFQNFHDLQLEDDSD